MTTIEQIALKLRFLEQTIFDDLITDMTDSEIIENIENKFDDIRQELNNMGERIN